MSDENINPAATAGEEAKVETAQAEANIKNGTSKLKEGAEHLRSAAEAKVKEFKSAAEAKAKELKETAEVKAREFRATAEAKATEFRGQAEKAWGQAQEKAKTLRSEGETYVRRNPSGAVLGALAAGFVLGLLFRKN